MDLALLSNVAPRVNQIIGSNPNVWSANVSGTVGAFPSDSEITAAALEADGELITKGYFNSINDTLAQAFMAASAAMVSGANVPFHYGNLGKVELSLAAPTFTSSGVDATADTITFSRPGHGFTQGQAITFSSTGSVPTGLVAGTTYYVIYVSALVIKVASSTANAATGTAIDLTSTGSGTISAIAWQPGIEVNSIDDINNAIAGTQAYVGANSMNYFYKIQDGNLYHSASYGRVEIPSFTRTTSLQANKADETLLVALTVRNLTKNASPAAFKEWSDMADEGMKTIIRDGSYQPKMPDENP